MKAILAFEDGRTFTGRSFTVHGEVGGEAVFNTGMTGYQEILTDPSYTGQIVTMTYPLIGTYGVNSIDVESDRIRVSALAVKEYQRFPSNYRAEQSLQDYLKQHNIIGIERLDTRAITRHIRKSGAMRAFISTLDPDPNSCIAKARSLTPMTGQDLATKVSVKKAYRWKHGQPVLVDIKKPLSCKKSGPLILTFDFGVKYNILRLLEKVGFEIIVVPSSTSAQKVKELKPDGILLSNGPGDPEPVAGAIETIRELIDYRPIFGICLGHQLIGLTFNCRTFKLKFGHRGSNQPVKNLLTGRVEITSQNHGFAVDMESVSDKDLKITHINLNDNTVEGFRHKKLPIIAVQYHPEASPGPHDSISLFDEFKEMCLPG